MRKCRQEYNKTILVQKRTIRVINNDPYNSHTDAKFNKYGILKLNCLFVYQSLLFISDYMSNQLPDSFSSCSPTNRDIHSNTTHQSKLLHIPTYSYKYAQRQPLFVLPKYCELNRAHCYLMTHQDINQTNN